MQKPDDDVSNLDAGVVDVVLHFDTIASGLQDAHDRVAQYGVAHVTDVRGLVWVDARVLDRLLGWIGVMRVARWRWTSEQCGQFRAIVTDVDVTGAGDFNARAFLDVCELRLEFLGDNARVLF